jgi:hypothetical protein
VETLLDQYEKKSLASEVEEEFWKLAQRAARNAGLDSVAPYV